MKIDKNRFLSGRKSSRDSFSCKANTTLMKILQIWVRTSAQKKNNSLKVENLLHLASSRTILRHEGGEQPPRSSRARRKNEKSEERTDILSNWKKKQRKHPKLFLNEILRIRRCKSYIFKCQLKEARNQPRKELSNVVFKIFHSSVFLLLVCCCFGVFHVSNLIR